MRRLRERGRTRGRAELSFDFYDDWDDDERAQTGGLLGGWGNDELDRLLAGSGSHSGPSDDVTHTAPRRKRGMSYGTRGRRKSLEPDPTVIPSTNTLGFLGRLPFKLGGTLRYKPSAADLQEHPGALRSEFRDDEEGEPLIGDEHDEEEPRKGHRRNRSSTTSSGETSDSFRSRGDLFPSDGEDDAVPLSDEFAMVLERRMTNTGTDDRSTGKARSSKGKRPAGSRTISRTLSRTTQASQSRPSIAEMQGSSGTSIHQPTGLSSPDMVETPSLTDLQAEEERVRLEEDGEVERKRQAAVRLAVERGLNVGEELETEESVSETKLEPPIVEDIEEPSSEPRELREELSAKPLPAVPPANNPREGPSETKRSNGFVPARLPHFG